MYETERGWHDRNAGKLPPRMLTPRDFYDEILSHASQFRRPLSFLSLLRLRLEALLVPRLISSPDISWYVGAGVPLAWQLVLNYLYRQGLISQPTTIPTRGRNDMPRKKNVLMHSRLRPRNKDEKEREFFSSGTHDNIEIAFSKAVGEVLERGTCARPAGVSIYRTSTQRLLMLRAPIVDPTHMALYSEKQREMFPRLRVRAEDILEWVRCEEVVSGRRALAPIDYFYWHRSHTARDAPFLFPATTSGMAGGFSRDEALESALREYVERDAFLAWWLTGQSPPRINFDDPRSPRLAAVFEETARCGLDVHFLDLTRDTGIPVAACVLIARREGEPLLTVGASAKAHPEDALISAYEEALSVIASDGISDDASVAFDRDEYVPFARRDISLKERSVFYRGEDRLQLARFFYTGAAIPAKDFVRAFATPASTARERAHGLIERLADFGCKIYVHYPGHRALQKLGYHTAAVLIPELLPMYLHETDAPLGHPRLAKLLANTGRAAPYPYPHPFP